MTYDELKRIAAKHGAEHEDEPNDQGDLALVFPNLKKAAACGKELEAAGFEKWFPDHTTIWVDAMALED